MAKIYAELIRKGLKTIDNVPARLVSQVEDILDGMVLPDISEGGAKM